MLKTTLAIAIALLSAMPVFGQSVDKQEPIKVSAIYYYGYQGLDLPAIKNALPLKEGQTFDDFLLFHQACLNIKEAVKRVVNKPSTDEALIFYGKRYILFVGLPGGNNRAAVRNPRPTGTQKVDPELHNLYDQLMLANQRQLASGDDKDKDAYVNLTKEIKKASAAQSEQLIDALANAADEKERLVAANALGQIVESKDQIAALVQASNDCDHVVRNNAVRALGVFLTAHPEAAGAIPCAPFIALLDSPEWTDRNKGTFVVQALVKSGDNAVIRQVREKALPSLTEMLEWPSGYSETARQILDAIKVKGDE